MKNTTKAKNTISYHRPAYVPSPFKAWGINDEGIMQFYVYILRLSCGKLYVGHTRELMIRMLEHKSGQTISTAGENPKLVYFEICSTRVDAMRREHELKRLIRYDKREIIRMIWNFHDLISEIDMI